MISKKLTLSVGTAGILAAAAVSMFALQANETDSSAPTAALTDADGPEITIFKSPNCSCCESWAEHLDAHGFEISIVETSNLNQVKQEHGVPRAMASCHTALIGDLVIEGHVPASDIVAYLEDPQANTLGLSVPGMPHGTPGMETGRKDDYEVIAFNQNGQTRVFSEHKDY